MCGGVIWAIAKASVDHPKGSKESRSSVQDIERLESSLKILAEIVPEPKKWAQIEEVGKYTVMERKRVHDSGS